MKSEDEIKNKVILIQKKDNSFHLKRWYELVSKVSNILSWYKKKS